MKLGIVIVLALTLAACGSNPPSTPAPSASSSAATSASPPAVVISRESPAPSIEPASPSPSPSPDATNRPREEKTPGPGPKPPYRRGDDVWVATDGLRLRSAPGVGADSVKYQPLLRHGAALKLRSDPVKASGYWWYEVRLLEGRELDGGIDSGWLAAADHDGSRWIGWLDEVFGPGIDGGGLEPVAHIPVPKLAAMEVETALRDGVMSALYRFAITNWEEFDDQLFEPFDFGDCPNPPTRTWVTIVDAEFGETWSFCDLTRPADLDDLVVTVPEGAAPPWSVYAVVWDRVTETAYETHVVRLPPSPFSSPSP